ncbi:DHH family phosphoesterase [Ructibacterium gallinarum]|uniref:DHH family phosphoesterase n=1 Tax=Ructibacterium gallinarum TaxID=2779355 RepID=A0A9D5M1K0_9FIRM|nr:DHH family phosphoesterase [Ructibacterium gallinarum]MBE5040927.1 DHH family phosphoesterase [Ructibacterium gallinarum]
MFEKMISALCNAEKIGIFTHTNPDGDAMGSAYSLKLVLEGMGKQAAVFLQSHPDSAALHLIFKGADSALDKSECDLLVALDCGDSKRLGEDEAFFLSHANTVAMDHHVTHQPFAKETVVEGISSTCELMLGLYRAMQVPLSGTVARNLYIGMVSDTGNFKYEGLTADTFRAAAALVEAGVDFAEISKKLFDTKTMEYYHLMRIALDRLSLYQDGKIAALYLSEEDFQKAGIEESQAPGIVTLPVSIEGVEAGIYLRRRGSEYKVSLRSAGKVDVAAVAAVMGGGGHVRASGYSVFQTLDPQDIIEDAIEQLQKQL